MNTVLRTPSPLHAHSARHPLPDRLFPCSVVGACPLFEAVDENGVEDGLLREPLLEPIVMMAVAPNGRFLACFSRDGMLAVMSSNFATKVYTCIDGR